MNGLDDCIEKMRRGFYFISFLERRKNKTRVFQMVLMMGGVYTPRLRENQKEEEKKKLGKNDSINRAAESAGSEVVGPPLS